MASCIALAALVVARGAAQLSSSSSLVNDAEYIDRLNLVSGATWVAASHKFFDGLTVNDAQVLLGAKLSHISEHMNETLAESVYTAIHDVPNEFDSRKQWPNLIHPIRNQEQCGSCWAFSASEVLSDRVAIASGKPSPVLSAEDLVSCDKVDHGCGGGFLRAAWMYLSHTGIVTDDCMPYTAGGGEAPKCAQQCVDSEPFVRTRATSAYAIRGPENMRKDIMTYGPIQVGFRVYRSFMNYRSGVYQKHRFEILPLGGHAVKIVGWGVDAVKGVDVDYWTVANSWGPSWGEEGFFRIVRGKNSCGIETSGPPFAGLAPVVAEDVIVV